MAVRARHDVHDRERIVVLVDLVAGQFAAQDLGEDVLRIVGLAVMGGHGRLFLACRGATEPCRTTASPARQPERRPGEGRVVRQFLPSLLDMQPLATEIVGDGAMQATDRRSRGPNGS